MPDCQRDLWGAVRTPVAETFGFLLTFTVSCIHEGASGGGIGGMGEAGAGRAEGGGTAGVGAGGAGQDADASGGCHITCVTPKGVCSNGSCVECLSDADCGTATKPICDMTTNTCGPCTSDSQCSNAPGVCMAHIDGHCATVAETIYVANTTGCNDSSPGMGTSSNPFCSMQPVRDALSSTRDLVLVKGTVAGGSWTFAGQGSSETSIIGQNSATVGGTTVSGTGPVPAFSMLGGIAYIRDVGFSPSSATGISATGGTLILDRVTVENCFQGGIFLDGAVFDIRNTLVSGNSGGQQGAFGWGGILVNSLPASGPAKLTLVTIDSNKPTGINCAGAVTAQGVLVTGNMSGDVGTTCGFSSCATAGPTCGAQSP